MNEEVIKNELAYYCENAGRLGALLESGESSARAFARNLLMGLQVTYLRGVGKELKTEIDAMQGRMDAAREARNARVKDLMKVVGPRIWEAWHRRALVKTGDDSEFIEHIVMQIPCSDCKEDFKRLIERYPPDWGASRTGGDDYFAYTVLIHNMVNEKLGKPTMTTEEARAVWGSGRDD